MLVQVALTSHPLSLALASTVDQPGNHKSHQHGNAWGQPHNERRGWVLEPRNEFTLPVKLQHARNLHDAAVGINPGGREVMAGRKAKAALSRYLPTAHGDDFHTRTSTVV